MARKDLLATVDGVRISGGVTIQQLAERDSLFRELADDIVKGGDEILCEWTKTDDAVVTLELKRSTVERLIQKKTEHEVDLEARVAHDIDEVQRLNDTIDILADHAVGEGQSWSENAAIELYTVNDLARRMKREGQSLDAAQIKKLIEEDAVQERAYRQWERSNWCKMYPNTDDCVALRALNHE